ncbi:hypothetical protein F4778DRAFT_752428 [Xylariomycetidae sp. FL2044]|nr:hypothetical protein F4778DRAFT_752428 [Xylariomycetidae sp. FL2044]
MLVVVAAVVVVVVLSINPLYRPRGPSLRSVFCATSQIPVYRAGCMLVPCVWRRVRKTFRGYTTVAPEAMEEAPIIPVANV